MNAIFMGTHSSFGVFIKSMESEFGLTRTAVSAVLSVRMALGAVMSFVGGWAIDRYSPRIIFFLMALLITLSLVLTSQVNEAWQLFFTFSLLLGLGAGASWVAVMLTVSRWFNKKRGLAVGLTGGGGGMGQVVMTPFAAFLISNYGWRIAYLAMGIIAGAIISPLSMFIKRDPKEVGLLPDGATADVTDVPAEHSKTKAERLALRDLSLKQALRTRSFWFISVSQILTSFSMLLITTHIVPHATDIGFTIGEGATILSLIGLAIMVGRILIGMVSDQIGHKKTAVLSSVVQIAILLLLLWSNELWMFYLFAVIYGFTQGGVGTALTAYFGDIFGLRNLGKLMGALNVSWVIGAAIGPVIGGLIFDITNSYSGAFWIIVIIMSIRPLLFTSIRKEMKD